MKLIPKETREQIDALVDELEARSALVREAIEDFNAELEQQRHGVEERISQYDAIVVDLMKIYDGLRAEAEAYYDTRSEKWQDSDAGQEYAAWIEALANVADGNDENVQPLVLDLPEDVEEPDMFSNEYWERPGVSPEEQ
jgi:DNA-binding transcriptional MerR regulator